MAFRYGIQYSFGIAESRSVGRFGLVVTISPKVFKLKRMKQNMGNIHLHFFHLLFRG